MCSSFDGVSKGWAEDHDGGSSEEDGREDLDSDVIMIPRRRLEAVESLVDKGRDGDTPELSEGNNGLHERQDQIVAGGFGNRIRRDAHDEVSCRGKDK